LYGYDNDVLIRDL